MDSKPLSRLSRRDALRNMGIGALAVAATNTLGKIPLFSAEEAEAAARSFSDVDILNFALNLEYLEAEFYAYAVSGEGIPSQYTKGQGREGDTIGGSATNFTLPLYRTLARQIANDELQHVRFLRKALGSKAVGKPTIKLNPLGSFTDQAFFFTYARAFEDTGVSAYGGAAPLIKNSTYLGYAARILATEAYHAGALRLLVIQQGIAVPQLDKKDVVPTASTFLAGNSQALSTIRTVAEVLRIVKPFFPDGLNGTIK